MDFHLSRLISKILILEWLLCCGWATEKWDYLVFTQEWPATVCTIHERNRISEKCSLPKNSLEWTIHGLWPSRIHGGAPSFCNKSLPFDESKITDIKTRLEKFWPNLFRDLTTDSLWKHEWEKHGTCALDFEPLDNEKKYFQKSLDLYGLYNITTLLPSLGIAPENTKKYNATNIVNLIQKKLSKVPHVECVPGKDNAEDFYLSEIRLCFNKGMQLIDCFGNHFTNCPEGCNTIYPDTVKLDGSR